MAQYDILMTKSAVTEGYEAWLPMWDQYLAPYFAQHQIKMRQVPSSLTTPPILQDRDAPTTACCKADPLQQNEAAAAASLLQFRKAK